MHMKYYIEGKYADITAVSVISLYVFKFGHVHIPLRGYLLDLFTNNADPDPTDP